MTHTHGQWLGPWDKPEKEISTSISPDFLMAHELLQLEEHHDLLESIAMTAINPWIAHCSDDP